MTAAQTPHPLTELKDLMLRAPRLTLSVAESLTCGWVQTRIGVTPGASNFFLGGLTAYELEQKVRHLRVDRAIAEPVNSVSVVVAEQMARGACGFFGSDLGLATTGYAEPAPEQNVAEPFAFWAVAHLLSDGSVFLLNGRVDCAGASRGEAQQTVTDVALTELVRYLRRWRAELHKPRASTSSSSQPR